MSNSNLEILQKNKNENNNNKKIIEKETYTKIKYLGEGTFGIVNLIQSNLTNIVYVCKDIDLSNLTKEKEKLALGEISVLKKCNHPNIILFKEAFITRNPKRELHLVMEYADSGDLEKKLIEQKQKNEHFEENIIINWLIQTCLGLKYLHNLHVIHRDIKPQNIFLTKKGIIKIGDFGISKVLDRNHKNTKTQIGTPLYMPPEVIESIKYDYKADIWSLGITFFELMYFSRPFGGNHTINLFMNIIKGKKRKSVNNNNNIYSEELIGIINKMISNDPNKRPTIDEILNVPFINKHLKEFLGKNKKLYNMKNKNKSISALRDFNGALKTIKEENENEEKNLKFLTQRPIKKDENISIINQFGKTQNNDINCLIYNDFSTKESVK